VALIVYAEGVDSPRTAPEDIARITGVGDPEVLLGWTVGDRPWLSSGDLRGLTTFPGWGLGPSGADRRLSYVPARLSSLPRLLQGLFRPEVAVVAGVRRGHRLAFASTAGWGPAAARAAGRGVVVEIAPDALDLGGPEIPGQVLAVVDAPPGADPAPEPRAPTAADLVVGRNVVSLLPDHPTLQVGPGGIAEAVLAALDRPVQVFSGLVTDAVARLDERGLLEGVATAGYVWGGAPVAGLHRRGRLRLVPVEETHDQRRLASIDRFVACNTAVQVGLDGAVNVERVGGRLVAGLGGHPDFCAAAGHSVGGLSVIALRSTTRRGASTIVADLEVVSTPRSDIEVVVTEHGVADLRGVDDAERARRLVAIAAPEHREALAAAAG
jgi:hypothetical protein